jgi:hypothetical protein
VKKCLIFIILSIVLSLTVSDCVTYALTPEATKASTQTASSAAEVSLKQKLDNLKKEVASRAAQMKKDVNKKLENKVVLGQVITSASNKIIVQTKKGEKTVTVNEYTVFQNDSVSASSKKKVVIKSASDLARDDYIVALGDLDDKDILTAKKIVKLNKPVGETKALWGQISESTPSATLIKLRDGNSVTLGVNKETNVFIRGQKGSVADLLANKTVIAIGQMLSKDNMQGKFLYVLTGGSQIIQEGHSSLTDKSKVGSNSAEASKSATKAATPKKTTR